MEYYLAMKWTKILIAIICSLKIIVLSEIICRQNKYILYDSICIKFLKCQLIYNNKIDEWLPRGGGKRRDILHNGKVL